MNILTERSVEKHFLVAGLTLWALAANTLGQQTLSSYGSEVVSANGISEDEAALALGAPDYQYTDGTFAVGVTVTYRFPAPIDDLPNDDLIISAFVTGTGTESSEILVEGRSSQSAPFVEIATVTTSDGRSTDHNPFAPFDHVHHFRVNFSGKVDKVIEIRLTNMEGDDFKLDSLEALHPALSSPTHAIEVRIFRLRDDFSKRFALRLKNIANLETGVALSGFAIEHESNPYIDQTNLNIVASESDGSFMATAETTAGPDNGDSTMRTEYDWNGMGEGLMPGDIASHERANTIDLDTPGDEFIENIEFSFTFADGVTLNVSGDQILTEGYPGNLFALYEYPPFEVSIKDPRPAYYVELASAVIVPEPECTNCNQGNDNSDGSENENENDNSSDSANDNGQDPGMTRGCNMGMSGTILLLMSFGVLYSPFRRRSR